MSDESLRDKLKTLHATAEAQAEAKGRLMLAFPHLRLAASMGKISLPGGTLHLGVLVKRADGSGTVVADFDLESFLADLLAVLGFASEDELVVAATAALDEEE